jgi:hypothetical protein
MSKQRDLLYVRHDEQENGSASSKPPNSDEGNRRSEIRRSSGSDPSVLKPRILNFDNSRSLTDRQEPVIPATTTVTAEGVTPHF